MLKTFDDYLIKPKFSFVKSRASVSTSVDFFGNPMTVPILSANMASITGAKMANEMDRLGGAGVLHRFCTTSENMNMIDNINMHAHKIGSFGISDDEHLRAEYLISMGVNTLCLDVAHAAQVNVVTKVKALLKKFPELNLIVGNFATSESINDFIYHVGFSHKEFFSRCMIKVGIGPGSACLTRVKTGVGIPQMASLMDIKSNVPYARFIADGGIRNGGDLAKSLLAGADMVMIGGLLSGTSHAEDPDTFSGSASAESYVDQGKALDGNRTAEGASFSVNTSKTTEDVINDLKGGLKSAMSYTGCNNLADFNLDNVDLVEVSQNTRSENTTNKINT